GQEHEVVAPSQPSSSTPPVPSTSSPPAITTPPPIHTSTPTPPPIPTPTPTPPPIPTPTPTPIPDTEPTPFEHTYEEPSPVHQHFSPPQEQAPSQMPMDDLLQAVPKLISRIDSLEMDLKQTKLTMGNAIVKLVKKVKKLELPKLISRIDSLEMDLKQTKLTMGNAIVKLVKKVKKIEGFLKRRNLVLTDSEEEEPEADVGAEQVNTASVEQVNTASGVNTGSIKLNTGDEQVSTVGAKESMESTSDQDKGQREGKAPMISEETPKKSKEQVLQEEASLAEAIRLDTQQREEVAKQVHLDSLLAQRIAEEEELNEQQKKRKAQVQFEAQHYTNEDWDLIRAKLEANAELSKSMLGSEAQGEDFAKKMVDLVNQRKKYFAEQRAKAKRNKPMTQTQLKTYMMNYLKNQGTWKLSQLKSLSFEEIKKEFDKLVK
ncbi:hypothetical protein Tco_1169309, partial [Tanacetum coccineum]